MGAFILLFDGGGVNGFLEKLNKSVCDVLSYCPQEGLIEN